MPWPDVGTALAVGTIMGLITAYFARRQGRKPTPWFFAGFFFGVLGLLFFFSIPRKKQPVPLTPVKPEPQPYVFGPAHKFWYFLDETHAQVGPMSYTALSNQWKQGKIKPVTLVWHEDLSNWKPLEELIRIKEPLTSNK